jgi:hypothetical protein
MVGALHYFSMTGPDIAFAVTIGSQFLNSIAAKYIVKWIYLKGTSHYVFILPLLLS